MCALQQDTQTRLTKGEVLLIDGILFLLLVSTTLLYKSFLNVKGGQQLTAGVISDWLLAQLHLTNALKTQSDDSDK